MTWNAIVTKPNGEKRVIAALTERGIAAYAPMETYNRTQHGRRTSHDRPLIRGYVFAIMGDRPDLFHEIDGATRLVSIDGHPATIPDGFIQAMREEERKGSYDRTRRKVMSYRPGERARIKSGPFVGIACTIHKLKGSKRVEVIGRFFSKAQSRMTVEMEKIEPDESPAEPEQKAA